MRRLAIVLLGLGVAPPRPAVAQPPAEPAFTTTGAFFALSVADLAASRRWYQEKLGLRVTMDLPAGDYPAVVALEGGGLVVELIHDRTATPRTGEPGKTHGISKVGMIVEDFDRAVATLRARGVEIVAGPFPPRAGQRANLLIRDNAGNLIQLFGRSG